LKSAVFKKTFNINQFNDWVLVGMRVALQTIELLATGEPIMPGDTTSFIQFFVMVAVIFWALFETQ